MSTLERGIKPLIYEMSRNGSREFITPAEMCDLAVWAHKTFMMYDQFCDPGDRRYPASEYRDFYEKRAITSDTHIFIAKSNSPYAGFGIWSDSRTLVPAGVDGAKYVREHGTNCGSAYLAIDGLVIFEQWFGANYPLHDLTAVMVREIPLRKMVAPGVHCIWPLPAKPLDWRRSRVIGADRTERARLALHATMASLSVVAKRVEAP
ncbi:hypothetical protein [Raineyella fluvialis]|uniref:Uncharacterized protein n=1 Tax=Raineyella fluvialis TaxID=2662261 RepID=A0A5Q2FG18_9ACTN|nr:hypothetical protein [Raineyella fluvialis]QGF24737.1 hypothetical protein Rai3103_15110 [Raineyella fluvialis]